ncbi:MAG: hypothetical protein IJC80_06245 [Clostridia bacterium]|nr:hypothetical protein [Clostridia bacterium]
MAIDSRMVMLLAIIRRGKGGTYIKALQEDNVVMHFQCVGEGTAPSEMMEFLGLGNSEKDIVISFATKTTADRIVADLGKNVGKTYGYQGLFMVIPTSAFSRISAEIIKKNSNDFVKGGVDNMQSEFKYSLVLIAVNRGFTDSVMQTAKKAGATGGTVIKARHAEADIVEAFANVKLEDEKEIVAILAPENVRNEILESVNTEFGLKSEAQGVVLSVPVEKVFKI